MAKPSEPNDERDESGPKVGALLQASRQRLGEEVADVASMLRIRLPYLVAIEAGRHQELPGPTYAVGFIRAYAEYLGLDSEEVVRRFKAETTDGGEGNRKLSFPTPVPETGIPGGAYVFIGLVIAVLGYGTWYLSTTKDDLFVEAVTPLDEQMITLLEDDETAMPEEPKSVSGSVSALAGAIVAKEVPALALPDNKLIKSEKLKPDGGSGASQVNAFLATEEAASAADVDTPSETVSQESAQSEVPVVIATSEPNPKPGARIYVSKPTNILIPNVKEFSSPQIKSVNVKTPVAIYDKPAEPGKVISVGQVQSKAIVEMEPSPKPERTPKPEEVNSEVITSVALVSEIKKGLPELPAELEATTTLAPIETVVRGSSRIKINAINNSWIQIRDDNSNTMLVTRLLAAGDSYVVPDQPGLVLLTGNAGALEIIVDGTTVPSIGGQGVVRRGVALEVGLLKAGAAVSN